MPGQYPNYETVGDEEAAMVAYVCSFAMLDWSHR